MKNKQAFTLIELILFLGLFTIILGVLTNLFSVIVDTQSEVQSTSAVETDTKFIEARLMHDIQRAESIDMPVSIGAQSGNLILTIDGEEYEYTISNGNLEINTDTTTDMLNSLYTEVTSISFQRFGNIGGKHAIKLDMTIDSRNETAAGQESKTIETMIGIR